jgi:hypothetical protein
VKLFVLTSLLITLSNATQASADVGLRHVTCYSSIENSNVVYTGDYDIVSQRPFQTDHARLVVGISEGKCILGDEISLPECMSMTEQVLTIPPCLL